jgi:hypothetical protein
MTERYYSTSWTLCDSKDYMIKKALELLDIDVIDGEIITVQQKLEPKEHIRTVN